MDDKKIYKTIRDMTPYNTVTEIYKYLEISKKQYYKILKEGDLLQILDLQKHNKSDKEICKNLKINKSKYYKLLDENYLCQIQDLQKNGWHTKDICKYLKIKKKKYNELVKGDLSCKKKHEKNIILRSDYKYSRIDNYRDNELQRGIIVEAITRIHDSEELFQTRELSNTKGLIQKESDLSDSQLLAILQDINKAMLFDKERIKEKIRKVSNSSNNISTKKLEKRLKNNERAIRMAIYIFELEKPLISKIFKKKSILNDPLVTVINYNHHNFIEKDYIDILNEQIDYKYNHYLDRNNEVLKKKNIELVKHYLLKYIQKPILKYGIDYSNTLLDEYNFKKVSLEIDMTIPKKKQKSLIEDLLTKLYSTELPFSYLEFMGQSLLQDFEDEKLNAVHKGKKASKDSPLAERVSSLFYIYDLKKRGVSTQMCINLLSSFYELKKRNYVVDTKTFELWYKKISAFMEEFEKKYKIQSLSI